MRISPGKDHPFSGFLSGLLLLIVFVTAGQAQENTIAIFGSSVANGSGDTTGAGGYAGLLSRKLALQHWNVINVSRGGDNTTKILPRFDSQLLPLHPAYVIIGLSLGNEGIANSSELVRNRVFEKYRSGMLQLIQLCRKNGMNPIVTNCYERNDFLPEQYEAVKQMNLIINTWDVPSVNFLGPLDNGSGNWLSGFDHDRAHPNYKGHQELFYSFVPSLFDAIKAGKPVPQKIRSSSYMVVSGPESISPLSFIPDDTIHSFSLCFLVKTGNDGVIAAIIGDKNSYIEVKKGKIEYHAVNGEILSTDTTSENKGWQYLAVSHQYASGLTLFYVNGKLAGKVAELIDPKKMVIGGSAGIEADGAPQTAGYKDVLIYRSTLNSDEVKALYYNQLLQSSLEIYAPLNDAEFKAGTSATNYAQSLSKLIIQGNTNKHAEE
ncbi:MAG: hypothetical protein HXX13_14285 [Bacteroidetes bacterium]|nr:hypothetical protein [Bacteroidota bacterium]